MTEIALPASIDWRAVMDHRLTVLAGVMQEQDLDALVLATFDNARYASNLACFSSWELTVDGNICVVARDGAVHVHSVRQVQRAGVVEDPYPEHPHIRTARAIPEVYAQSWIAEPLATQIAAQLLELRARRIGVDALQAPLAAALSAHLDGGVLIGVGDELLRRRMIKHVGEIAALRSCADQLTVATSAGIAAVAEGGSQPDVSAVFGGELLRSGAELLSHVIVAPTVAQSTRVDVFEHAFGAGPLAEGTVVLDGGHYGPGGFVSDIARTTAKGPLPAAVEDAWGRVLQCYETLVDGIRAGRLVNEHVAESDALLAEAGFVHPIPFGHGIGLRMVEPPSMPLPEARLDGARFADARFESNMVFCFELQLDFEGYPLSVEDMLLVGDDAPIRLTELTYDLRP